MQIEPDHTEPYPSDSTGIATPCSFPCESRAPPILPYVFNGLDLKQYRKLTIRSPLCSLRLLAARELWEKFFSLWPYSLTVGPLSFHATTRVHHRIRLQWRYGGLLGRNL